MYGWDNKLSGILLRFPAAEEAMAREDCGEGRWVKLDILFLYVLKILCDGGAVKQKRIKPVL